MPTDSQKIFIPFSVGLDESADDRVMPVGKLQMARNVELDKAGALVKRHGFTALQMDKKIDAGNLDGIRGIFSTGRELCAIDERNLWACWNHPSGSGYGPSAFNGWIRRGHVSPFTGKTRRILRNQFDWRYVDADCDTDAEYILVAGQAWQGTQSAAPGPGRSWCAVFKASDWQTVHEPEEYQIQPTGAPTAGSMQQPKVSRTRTNDIVAVGIELDGVNYRIGILQYRADSPWTPPADTGATGSAQCHYNPKKRIHDAQPGTGANNRDLWVAYVDAAQANIRVDAFREDTYAVVNTIVIPRIDANHIIETVAIYHDGVTEKLYLIWAEYGGLPAAMSAKVRMARYDSGTLAQDWITAGSVWSSAETESEISYRSAYVHTLGCVPDGAGRVIGAWTYTCVTSDLSGAPSEDLVSSPYVQRTHSIALDSASGSNASQCAQVIARNAAMLTKPWTVDGRVFVTLMTAHEEATGGGSPGSGALASYQYRACTTYQLDEYGNGEPANPDYEGMGKRWLPCAHHDVGTASRQNMYMSGSFGGLGQGEGAAINVFAPTADTRCYLNHSRSETAHLSAAPWDGTDVPWGNNFRACDAITLTYYPQPQVASLQQGQCYVSGGLGAWYDGLNCWECHVPEAPLVFDTQTYNGADGQLPDNTECKYQCIWMTRDESGTVHRSGPSPVHEQATDPQGGDANHNIVYVANRPWTERWYPSTWIVALYRLQADGVYYRCNLDRNTVNDCPTSEGRGTDWINVCDMGVTIGEALYTTGGVLENVAPEGFRHCIVHNERVWTGGHYMRARIQYSKRFTPGTASELLFAPEFHESMGFVLPDGEDCNGLAPLDDKVIVFSDKRIYAVAGAGPDDAGANSDFSQLTLIAPHVGCDDSRSIVAFPHGVMFVFDGEVYILTRQLSVEPIGEAIRDSLDTYPHVVSADCLPERHQVLLTCVSDPVPVIGAEYVAVLVYDYRFGEWFEWIPHDTGGQLEGAVDACVHDGRFFLALPDEVFMLDIDNDAYWDDSAEYVASEAMTAWAQPSGQAGWQRVTHAMLHAEHIHKHKLRMRVYTDFHPTATDDHEWDDATLASLPGYTGAKREDLEVLLSNQTVQAVCVHISDSDDSSGSSSEASGSKWFGCALRVQTKPQLARIGADARE